MLKKVFFVLGIMFFLFPVYAQESYDEPYLSMEDQEAILDKMADAIIDATVTVEHKQDSQPIPEQKDTKPQYLVRIEIYS
jgi:hypothetical protein